MRASVFVRVGLSVRFMDPTTGLKKSREYYAHDWGGLPGCRLRADQQVRWLRSEGFVMVKAEWLEVPEKELQDD